jgi:hypothetical protein
LVKRKRKTTSSKLPRDTWSEAVSIARDEKKIRDLEKRIEDLEYELFD